MSATEEASALQKMTAADIAELRQAMVLLEQDTFTETVLNRAGKLMGGGLDVMSRFLPMAWRDNAAGMLETVLAKAFERVLLTIDRDGTGLTGRPWLDAPLSSSWIDGASAVLSGALGGLGGPATTAVELPITTALLMRGIAQTALREGEDLRTVESKLECLKVLALGGSAGAPDAGYYSVRLAVAEAVPALAHRTLQEILPKLLTRVAQRFSVPVSAKIGSQAAPGIGAAAGALINLAFVDHFHRKALGHFRVRRFERTFGADEVRRQYEALRLEWLTLRARPASPARSARLDET